jgi:hypothetical protein
MKNTIAIASAFLAASSFSTAEIVINDFLSFEGFVDMSYTHTDVELGNLVEANESNFAVDQVEISWLFDFDPVTAQIDFAHLGSDSGRAGAEDTGVEQAFATYHFDGGSALTAGLYASMLGFEAFEPTGLYQYSFAYDMLAVDTAILPGYAQGVKYTNETDTTFFGISLQDGISDGGVGQLGGNNDESNFAVEAAGSIIFAEGVTGFLGAAYEDSELDNGDTFVINSYITFETGAWIFAGEVNYGDFEEGAALADALNLAADEEVIQALVMANFAYSDAASVTGRLSYSDHDADGADADFLKLSLAHGYAFTDNLFLVNEVSFVDGDVEGADVEGLFGAVELIFSF